MHLKRWFFGVGVALGAAAVYQIVTQRKPQAVLAPSLPAAARPPVATAVPTTPRASATAPAPTPAPAPATAQPTPVMPPTPQAATAPMAATEPVTTPEDLRQVVSDTAGSVETATTPVAAAMATAVAELDQADEAPVAATSTSRRVIGNTHKMVYHMEDDAHLPIEDNRVYFASEKEALDAGYRKAEPLA